MDQQAPHQPRKRPRQARARATWDRLLDAAAQVFATEGFAETTTDLVAREAGVSVGSLYQYFPNKESLLRELALQHLHRSTALLAPLGEFGSDRPWLQEAVEVVVREHATQPELHRVILQNLHRVPDVAARYRTVEAELVEAVATRLTPGNRTPGARDRLAARMVVTTVETLGHRLATDPGIDREELVDEIVALVSPYLRRRAEATTPDP